MVQLYFSDGNWKKKPTNAFQNKDEVATETKKKKKPTKKKEACVDNSLSLKYTQQYTQTRK